MPRLSWPLLAPWVMLLGSNVFMTFAWYGHLKHKGSALWLAVLASWGIAAFEYMLAVPANRIGSAVYTTGQLKTIQEAITLFVFILFSVFWMGEPLKASTVAGFVLILAGAGLVFLNR